MRVEPGRGTGSQRYGPDRKRIVLITEHFDRSVWAGPGRHGDFEQTLPCAPVFFQAKSFPCSDCQGIRPQTVPGEPPFSRSVHQASILLDKGCKRARLGACVSASRNYRPEIDRGQLPIDENSLDGSVRDLGCEHPFLKRSCEASMREHGGAHTLGGAHAQATLQRDGDPPCPARRKVQARTAALRIDHGVVCEEVARGRGFASACEIRPGVATTAWRQPVRSAELSARSSRGVPCVAQRRSLPCTRSTVRSSSTTSNSRSGSRARKSGMRDGGWMRANVAAAETAPACRSGLCAHRAPRAPPRSPSSIERRARS